MQQQLYFASNLYYLWCFRTSLCPFSSAWSAFSFSFPSTSWNCQGPQQCPREWQIVQRYPSVSLLVLELELTVNDFNKIDLFQDWRGGEGLRDLHETRSNGCSCGLIPLLTHLRKRESSAHSPTLSFKRFDLLMMLCYTWREIVHLSVLKASSPTLIHLRMGFWARVSSPSWAPVPVYFQTKYLNPCTWPHRLWFF